MRRSDIFDSFVKIAEQKGLISKADHAEHTEKDFHETNPRHDSLTIEQISKLYGNKTPTHKEMEYKNNIMEIAHPDPVIISPSYDKINGLVENNIERQRIMINIVRKDNDGILTQRKYAHQQLLLSLVRVANDLDNNNKEELRKLADVCLEQAAGKKKLNKVAFPFLIAGVAALVGALYAKQHLRFHSDGFKLDYQKAMAEIDDLLQSNSNWGVGYSFTPEFIQTITQLKAELGKLDAVVEKVLPLLAGMEKPRDLQELKAMAQQPQTNEIAQALAEYQQVYNEVEPFFETVMIDFKNEGYKQRAIAQKGFLSSMVDSAEVLHGGGGLIADDFDDVRHALETIEVDIKNIATGLGAYQQAKNIALQKLQASQSQSEQTFSQPATPEVAPPAKQEAPDEAESLMSQMSGALGR